MTARASIGLMLLMAACAGPAVKPASDTVELDPASVAATYSTLTGGLGEASGASGSARFAASSADGSERGTVRFSADRTRTLLEFRNSLGIEGLRILVDADSITVYNRIEGTVEKGALAQVRVGAFDGALSVPLLDVLNPEWSRKRPVRAFRTAESWLFWHDDTRFMVFNRTDNRLSRYEFGSVVVDYEESDLWDGFRFARRLNLRTRDGRSSVHLRLQTLQPNPVSLDFDLRLPAGLVIRRL